MNLIKPQKLKKGDKIGIIALSGDINSKENVFRAQEFFENEGYQIELCKNIFDKNRYLAGDDQSKVDELHRFFKDPEIKMILAARGGYGAIRLIDKIDFELIKNNPKIFAGYSDLTAIEAMLLKKCGLITFYAPHAQSDFGIESVIEPLKKSFFNTISAPDKIMLNQNNSGKVYFEGDCNGIFWGGNLSTLVSLCGIDFIPDEKFIFFAEDLNEPAYKIDRMFTQLLNIENFRKNLQGIVLGDFLDAEPKDDLEKFFEEMADKLQKPMISGFKITHQSDKITVPYGAFATLNCEKKQIIFSGFLSE